MRKMHKSAGGAKLKGGLKSGSKDTLNTLATVATLGTNATLGPLLPHATLTETEIAINFVPTTGHNKPSPLNFAEYLPWACRELNVDANVHVTRSVQNTYVRVFPELRPALKSRSKMKQPPQESPNSTESDQNFKFIKPISQGYLGITVNIVAQYDSSNNLLHLKFIDNKEIPKGVLQVINLIAHFYPQLHAITIRRGIDKNVLHQLCQLQSLANITEIYLEHCYLKEGCYYVLLESHITLKCLSLPRCSIEDNILEAIAVRLKPPFKASKTLVVLDLKSNKITDIGAKYLGDVLKTNRKLSYLSLMNNEITDIGAIALLDKLMPFILRPEEYRDVTLRRARYLAYKSALIVRTMADFKADELAKRKAVKRLFSSPLLKTKGSKQSVRDMNSLRRSSDSSSNPTLRGVLYEKAKTKVEMMMAELCHPYNDKNTIKKGNFVYCRGNNVLNYLNLAYNSLTMMTLNRLLEVVKSQRETLGGGLISVNLDGNPMPKECQELADVDEMLRIRLASFMPTRAHTSASTKRRASRNTMRN